MQARFGKIRIMSPGQEALPQFRRDLGRGDYWEFKKGEYYLADCPWHCDSGKHLYVSYLFGVWQPEYSTAGYELAHCYHGCMEQQGRRKELFELLYHLGGRGRGPHVRDLEKGVPYVPPSSVDPPGAVVLLKDLPDHHQAVEYILSRGYDPVALSDQYGVGYCQRPSDDYPLMNHRIVIPIWCRGRYVGWQGRVIGEARWAPKYVNWDHFSKSHYLYGFDNATRYKTIVRVEGVSDVWSIGLGSVATFGSSLSTEQAQMMYELVGHDGVLVWLYDMNGKNGDGTPSDEHQQAILERLRAVLPGRVLEAILPVGTDPGSFDQTFNHAFLNGVLRSAGVPWELETQRDTPLGVPPRRVLLPTE
jgi:hypothetical protein